MNRQFASRALSVATVLLAGPTIAGAVLLEDLLPLLRAAAFASGALVLVAAWLLFRFNRVALLVLWLSLAIYVASIFGPALVRHGSEVFASLIPAFYWSVAARLALVLAAHWALKPVAAPVPASGVA